MKEAGGSTEARSTRRPRQAAAAPRLEAGERPRTGAKRTVMDTIRQLPNYVRLLFGLFRDSRVAPIDKVLVGAAIAYIIAPVDLIPDWIPFLGEVDDVFLLVTALQRLISNAGRSIVTQYWLGDPAELASMNLRHVLAAAAFFLPRRLRRRLRTIGRP
jgi:uncharacterized membrane protein YkvA (DUF1232 family)